MARVRSEVEFWDMLDAPATVPPLRLHSCSRRRKCVAIPFQIRAQFSLHSIRIFIAIVSKYHQQRGNAARQTWRQTFLSAILPSLNLSRLPTQSRRYYPACS